MILWGPGVGRPACCSPGAPADGDRREEPDYHPENATAPAVAGRHRVWGMGRSRRGWGWDGLPGPGWIWGLRRGTALRGKPQGQVRAAPGGQSPAWHVVGGGWGAIKAGRPVWTQAEDVLCGQNPAVLEGLAVCPSCFSLQTRTLSVVGGGAGLSLEFIVGLLM